MSMVYIHHHVTHLFFFFWTKCNILSVKVMWRQETKNNNRCDRYDRCKPFLDDCQTPTKAHQWDWESTWQNLQNRLILFCVFFYLHKGSSQDLSPHSACERHKTNGAHVTTFTTKTRLPPWWGSVTCTVDMHVTWPKQDVIVLSQVLTRSKWSYLATSLWPFCLKAIRPQKQSMPKRVGCSARNSQLFFHG